MPEYTRRRLDQKPSKEELDASAALLSAPQPPISGFGVPKKFEPPKPPEKPSDLDKEVVNWLEGQPEPNQ